MDDSEHLLLQTILDRLGKIEDKIDKIESNNIGAEANRKIDEHIKDNKSGKANGRDWIKWALTTIVSFGALAVAYFK